MSLRRLRLLVFGLIGLLAVECAALALDAAFPPNLRRAERASPVVLDRNGAWLRVLPVEGGRWRLRADLDRTDPLFLKRLVAMEDARFYWHRGIDPVSLARAVGVTLATGHVRSGASTLTMQTARLLEPRPRTIGSKLIEMARALQLEARFGKRQILGLYLTLAPYGGDLEGARAASLAYFGHEPESLTDGEQALLIALPQAPEARRPDRKPQAARAARARVLDRLAQAGCISRDGAAAAKAEPLGARADFPTLAWQAAGEMAQAAPTDQASIVTTIDARLQRRLEAMAAQALQGQDPRANAAILVVEIKTRAVRAAVGAADRERPGGWMDLTRALRSPGSTLKPFIYGFAFDDGLAAPDTLIQDQPRRFADYQPENFDRVFHGQVTVREALDYSLNMPAVATLDRVGPETFLARLQAAHVRLERPSAPLVDPGLSLALGGEGISLRDLALLYAALGDDGVAKPLAFTEAEAVQRQGMAGVRLMRPESAREILDILRETPAPAGRMPPALAQGAPRMAFKTGTSYGYRDALAAGVVGGYALVVWTGRADGGARDGLTGRDAALPLLFDAADALAGAGAAPHPIAPRDAPEGLTRFAGDDDGPRLIFPPDGAVIQADDLGPRSRGLVLAAEGQDLTWYADGAPLPRDPVSQSVVWRPAAAGFYALEAVDSQGRKATAHVRVKTP